MLCPFISKDKTFFEKDLGQIRPNVQLTLATSGLTLATSGEETFLLQFIKENYIQKHISFRVDNERYATTYLYVHEDIEDECQEVIDKNLPWIFSYAERKSFDIW